MMICTVMNVIGMQVAMTSLKMMGIIGMSAVMVSFKMIRIIGMQLSMMVRLGVLSAIGTSKAVRHRCRRHTH